MKNKKSFPYFDLNEWEPVIEQSICNGERTAGFRNKETHKISQVLLIKNSNDLDDFCHHYNLTREAIKIIY